MDDNYQYMEMKYDDILKSHRLRNEKYYTTIFRDFTNRKNVMAKLENCR